MTLDRRSLPKKGALAGLLTAGAAALGVANAPHAAAVSNMQRLVDWKYKWGGGIYTSAPRP